MATRFFVIDSGSTARLAKRFLGVDSGGTTRAFKRAFVIDSGGTARLVFTSAVISITSQNLSAGPGLSGVNQSATYRLNSNGNVEQIITNASGTPLTSTIEQWVTPTSAAGDFECMASGQSGTFSAGTFGSWLALSSTRAWTVSTSVPDDFVSGSFTIEIRRVGGSTIEDSATISLSAE